MGLYPHLSRVSYIWPLGVFAIFCHCKQMCKKYPFPVICHRMGGSEREVPRSATVKVKGELCAVETWMDTAQVPHPHYAGT